MNEQVRADTAVTLLQEAIEQEQEETEDRTAVTKRHDAPVRERSL